MRNDSEFTAHNKNSDPAKAKIAKSKTCSKTIENRAVVNEILDVADSVPARMMSPMRSGSVLFVATPDI